MRENALDGGASGATSVATTASKNVGTVLGSASSTGLSALLGWPYSRTLGSASRRGICGFVGSSREAVDYSSMASHWFLLTSAVS